jgi:signal transduction histidine kinase
LTKHEDKNEQPLFKDANHEKLVLRAQFAHELIHEFTNMVTAVIGYSELALHAIEDSHPAREWLEKIHKHTRELGALLHKLIVLKTSKQSEKP